MKSRFIIFLAAVLITPFFMTSCDEELDVPPVDTVEDYELLTIADIYQIHADSGDNYTFEDDYILYATVTMDDFEGNIYKEAYVEDTSGGVNLYKFSYAEMYEVGQYIRINLNGVSLYNYEGKLELLFTDILDTEKSIILQQEEVPLTPAVVTIEEIETGDYNCKLVELQNIQFSSTDTSHTYATEGGTFATNRNVEDCSGKEIAIRTSDYANFASYEIPNGNGTIIGIATKYRDDWQILIRSIDEVNMEDLRCE